MDELTQTTVEAIPALSPGRLPWECAAWSAILPGLGQWLAGYRLWGVICFLCVLALSVVFELISDLTLMVLVALCISAAYVLVIIDAYRSSPLRPTPEELLRTNRLWKMVFLSAIVPGLGQMCSSRRLIGWTMLIACGFALLAAEQCPEIEAERLRERLSELVFSIFVAWSMIDAYLVESRRLGQKPKHTGRLAGAIAAGAEAYIVPKIVLGGQWLG